MSGWTDKNNPRCWSDKRLAAAVVALLDQGILDSSAQDGFSVEGGIELSEYSESELDLIFAKAGFPNEEKLKMIQDHAEWNKKFKG